MSERREGGHKGNRNASPMQRDPPLWRAGVSIATVERVSVAMDRGSVFQASDPIEIHGLPEDRGEREKQVTWGNYEKAGPSWDHIFPSQRTHNASWCQRRNFILSRFSSFPFTTAHPRLQKCDEQRNVQGSCKTCIRLCLQCLGLGAKLRLHGSGMFGRCIWGEIRLDTTK